MSRGRIRRLGAMSLRARMSVIICLLLLFGMVLGVVFQIIQARQRVAREVDATARLTFALLDNLLPAADAAGLSQEQFRGLGESLSFDHARHLSIRLESAEGTVLLTAAGAEDRAPAWFISLVRPEPLRMFRPLDAAGRQGVVLETNPADEIAEAWQESKTFLGMLLLVLLFLNGVLYVTIGRWLRPVSDIVRGLAGVEQGDFSGQVAENMLPELSAIAEKLNQLTRVLKSSKEENDRLTRRSLSIQEEERRHLAQELHDEMGQSISAIKAIAFSMMQRGRGGDDVSARGADKIVEIAGRLRDQVRGMMRRLRPPVLDEQGLVPALQQMVDDWNLHHLAIFCSLKVEGDFAALDDGRQIHLYRIVQEALTNVVRHANADLVSVRLSAAEGYRLEVEDNGRGFDPGSVRKGMGLSGIADRVRGLNGEWRLESAGGRGTRVTVEFPVADTERARVAS